MNGFLFVPVIMFNDLTLILEEILRTKEILTEVEVQVGSLAVTSLPFSLSL